MDRLAKALERLSSAQPAAAKRADFKAPDFSGEGDIQQYQEVAAANDWSETAALLHIRTHLRDYANECGNYSTLEEVFRALRSKYGISRWEARTQLRGRHPEVLRPTDGSGAARFWGHVKNSL